MSTSSSFQDPSFAASTSSRQRRVVAVLTAASLQGVSGPAARPRHPPPPPGTATDRRRSSRGPARAGHDARVSPRSSEGYTLDRAALADRPRRRPAKARPRRPRRSWCRRPTASWSRSRSPSRRSCSPPAAAHPEITTYSGRGSRPHRHDPPRPDPDGLPRIGARSASRGVVRRPRLQRRRQPLPLLPRQRGAGALARPRRARASTRRRSRIATGRRRAPRPRSACARTASRW